MKTENEQLNTNEENSPPVDPAKPEQQTLFELENENQTLRQKVRTQDARERVVLELRAAGAITPELLSPVVERDLQFGDDGEAVNVTALVERVKKYFPAQFAAAVPTAIPGIDGGAGRNDPRPLTKEALAKMSAAQIAALDWQEVKQALKS